MQFKTLLLTFVLATSIVAPLHAEGDAANDALNSVLLKSFGRAPDKISSSPLAGIKEVIYGTDVYYVSQDGRYLLSGALFDLKAQSNLTEQRLSGLRLDLLKTIDESKMIVFKAKGKQKHVITVFTDIDCVYCRKLHSGMAEMNKLGITVRYLSYPRAGLGSPSYDKAVSVWCAKDRNKAMDDAKNHNKIVPKTCADSPVKEQYLLGQRLGINSTPSILLEDGHLMRGYTAPERLFALLEKGGKL